MEALLALLAVVLIAAPFVNFILFWVERRRRRAAAETLELLAHRVRDLERRLDEADASASGSSAEPARREAPARPEPLPATVRSTPPEPPREVASPPPPEPPPAPAPVRVEIPPPVVAAAPPTAPPPEPAAAEVRPPLEPKPRSLSLDWESLVGVRLFSWMAGVTLLVAAVAFLRYSMEHGWLGPPIRVAIGLAVGVALLVGCETKRAQRYRPTALALTAAGIATLFSTFYAAHALWRLLPALPTFALLALVTAVAVALSIRRDSVFIALLGLVGGFATPVLLSTGEDRPLGLFSYLALLDVGLAWVAYRKRWPLLAALSMAFTALYQLGWVVRFYEPGKLAIGVAVFLVFPLVGFGGLALARRGSPLGGADAMFRWTVALGAVPPVLFAFHAAASSQAAQWPLLFGFLFLVAAGLAAVAALQGPEWIHLLGGAGTIAAVGGWITRSFAPEAWPGFLALLAALVALYLGVPLLLARKGRDFREDGRLAEHVAPSLLFAFALAAQHHGVPGPVPFFLPLLLLAAACAAFAVARGAGSLLAVAAVASIAAELVWSASRLSGASLLPALLAFAAFGLLFLGAPLLAEHRGRPLHPAGRPFLLLLAALAVLAGHAPLLQAGVRASLARPPEPVLAILLLLDLAFVAGALLRREGTLVIGAMGASVVLLLCFAGGAEARAVAAVAVAGLGLVPFLLAARRGAEPRTFLPGAAVGLFGAQAVLLFAGNGFRVDLPVLLPANVLLLLGLLLLAWQSGAQRIALAASVSTLAVAAWVRFPEPPGDARMLALVAPLYLLLLGYPLARGARARGERLPFVAAIVGSALSFLVAREAIVGLGGGGAIGLLPVVQAALLVPHLVRLLRMEPPSERDRGRLAGVAGAILAFVTAAIPLQLEKQWITLGWALQGAALAWLYRRIVHRGLLAWCAALFGAVFVRLALNPEVFHYQPKSSTPILNWYLYTYVVAAAACYAGAVLLAATEDRLLPRVAWLPRLSRILPALGTALLFLLVNIEIADFFSEGPRIVFRFSAGLASDLSYTIAWALFAILLLAAGVALRAKAARIASIALLVVTVLKGFLHDLSKLEGLYRVGSFVGLAVSLALVAVVLQRFVLRAPQDSSPGRNA